MSLDWSSNTACILCLYSGSESEQQPKVAASCRACLTSPFSATDIVQPYLAVVARFAIDPVNLSMIYVAALPYKACPESEGQLPANLTQMQACFETHCTWLLEGWHLGSPV